jgi:hypothetical protein
MRRGIAAQRCLGGADQRGIHSIVERLRIHLVVVANGQAADLLGSIELRGTRRNAAPSSQCPADHGAARRVHSHHVPPGRAEVLDYDVEHLAMELWG